MIHIAAFNINSSNELQSLNKTSIANSKANKILIKVSDKYTYFANIF